MPALDEPSSALHVVDVTPGSRRLLRQLASLAQPGQILLSRSAFDLARDAPDGLGEGLVWLAHGSYLFDGMSEPADVFEVGRPVSPS